MEYKHEQIENILGLPFKVFIHSVDEMELHWHKHMEILFVLSGEIILNLGKEELILKEKDLILINTTDIHSTRKSEGDNLVLGMQIDTEFFNRLVPGFSRKIFRLRSFEDNGHLNGKVEEIKTLLAKFTMEISKKEKGFSFRIGGLLLDLLHTIYTNFGSGNMEEVDGPNRESIKRINEILRHIDDNYDKGLTLGELADRNKLNTYYLSHYIKDSLGITFQEYIDSKRLDKAISLLGETDMRITDIAYESGFPNPKSLNKLLKKKYGCTPSEYRENQTKLNTIHVRLHKPGRKKVKSYFDIETRDELKSLYDYLDHPESKHIRNLPTEKIFLEIDFDADSKGALKKNWNHLMTFGRAAEGLRADWRDQLEEIQKELGFRYVRFHGIFSDDMMVFNRDHKGNVVYNWTYVDQLFDFLLQNNLKPFVELGFMPSEIARSQDTVFFWRGNVSPPKDLDLWKNLVESFLIHCIDRYGIEEVTQWYFEIWNEPELEGLFWTGGQEEFFRFFMETVACVRKVSERIRVGGPAVTHHHAIEGTFMERFLDYAKATGTKLDFASVHIYSDNFADEEESKEIMSLMEDKDFARDFYNRFPSVRNIYHHMDHTEDTLDRVRDLLAKKNKGDLPLVVTEWNASTSCRNPINDTSYVATHIIRNLLRSRDKADMIGYWTFTDILEEFKAGISHFHGGFGLINRDGIKKPSYYAYYLLNKLGKEVLQEGEDHIVTRSRSEIQILAYNYAYFDEAFKSGDTSLLSHEERYRTYAGEVDKILDFKINVSPGSYLVKRYRLDRENGSAFDKWVEMGMPEDMTREEVEYLKGVSRPAIKTEIVEAESHINLSTILPPHGTELITIRKNH
ncbi:MAG TPA: helix-turn-helix domain-containing protein [Tissierellaceae bacterium]|nr:helix-turn-helix domain-containing protein [Tissierellaceae bacterium]